MTITDTNRDPALLPKFFGLSTDTKPSSNIPIGSAFYETDTKHGFVFDGEWRRTEQIVVEQAAAVVVKDVQATDELLGEILGQMKIQNAHLAFITQEDFDGSNG